jgi:hypothetical protein
MNDQGSLELIGDRGTWTFQNDGARDVVVAYEPWADEITVKPGSTLVLGVWGGTKPRDGSPPMSVSREGDRITVWAQWPGPGPGGRTSYLDGEEV